MTLSATPRGLLLGAAAESYERFRLGYPDEVVDRTLTYAGGHVATAVEVGAGTGKATRAFASRGIAVTALEPDPDMFTVLERETVGTAVRPVRSTFEAYAGPRADLVYAAAAYHWTAPATRWRHTVDLLVDGGVVALFGGPMRVADPDLHAAVEEAGRPVLGVDDPPAADGTGPGTLLREGLVESGLFTDVQEHRIEREVVLPQREYVGYLSTVSAYLRLPLEVRQGLLHRVASVLPSQVRVDHGVRLVLARSAGRT